MLNVSVMIFLFYMCLLIMKKRPQFFCPKGIDASQCTRMPPTLYQLQSFWVIHMSSLRTQELVESVGSSYLGRLREPSAVSGFDKTAGLSFPVLCLTWHQLQIDGCCVALASGDPAPWIPDELTISRTYFQPVLSLQWPGMLLENSPKTIIQIAYKGLLTGGYTSIPVAVFLASKFYKPSQ